MKMLSIQHMKEKIKLGMLHFYYGSKPGQYLFRLRSALYLPFKINGGYFGLGFIFLIKENQIDFVFGKEHRTYY